VEVHSILSPQTKIDGHFYITFFYVAQTCLRVMSWSSWISAFKHSLLKKTGSKNTRMQIRIPTKTPHNPTSKQTHRGKTMFITIHSYKGGTEKSLIAANLAMIFATSGKDVCLIDLDLSAPSLNTTFKNNKKHWINDYLNKLCRIDQTLNN